MLVLARQKDQAIRIGSDVTIKVVDIRGDKVRLGIEAPRNVGVHRQEVYDAILKENREAATIKPDDVRGNAIPVDPATAPAVMRLVKDDPHPAATKDAFMLAAIEEARQGMAEGGVPIGAVLVRDGKIVGRGRNRRIQNNDPTAHAEMECLRNAGRLPTYADTTLYSTLLSCPMCSGAIVHMGVRRLVVAESVHAPTHTVAHRGTADFLRGNGVEVTDLHDRECTEMVAAFIRDHPDLWTDRVATN